MDERVETQNRASREQLIVVGEFLLDHETIRVWRGHKPLKLSLRQFRLLDVFMRQAGIPVSIRSLREAVWSREAAIEGATVAAEIMRLRRAIGGRRRESPIRTVRKFGYVFDPPRRRGQIINGHDPAVTDSDGQVVSGQIVKLVGGADHDVRSSQNSTLSSRPPRHLP